MSFHRTSLLLVCSAAVCCTWSTAIAQTIDWKTFDPKRASPKEMERVIEFLDRNADRLLAKRTGDSREIKSLIMRGNKITTIVYNYGNITRPNTLGNVADLVWNRLGYGFEFTPLVAAEVTDVNGDTVHIVDDGMWLPNQGGYSPDQTVKWGWLPKLGFAASGQADIAAWSHRNESGVAGDLTRRPHSWPESFYNAVLGRYVWPAFLGNDASTPDEEVYFVADDYTNEKYLYYPFPGDSTKRGLGLDLEVRFFQFNNPLAEDIIFLVYRVTNRSAKTLNKVYFGMHGDPHVGGPSDYLDDRAFFIPPRGPLADPYAQRARSMVYSWDDDMKGSGGLPAGYFGFKFLESPTNSSDAVDNDDDGITDESPANDAGVYIDGSILPLTTGISDTAKYRAVFGAPKPRWSGDEDGDWDPLKDDVGIDGLPGTGDLGEGNGKPDIGFDANNNLSSEPSFGIRDVHESDQIGLTSFYALPYTQSLPNVPKNDILYWQLLSSDSISIDQELFNNPGDNIFVYGSGPFQLAPGETQRFSVALLMGSDLQDLLLNSETSQRVLEANYRFAAPPPKPTVTAVPGDGRVTIYWDDVAEEAKDPLTGDNDFEGYKIYRSEDPTFSDVYSITDANGNPFLGRAFAQNGVLAQYDLINTWSGLHPVEYEGRGIRYDVGANTGLRHEYVDSSVQNGRTYYYAVVSYDHGSTLFGVEFPPSESQAVIQQDPITQVLSFDVNTARAIPGPPAAGTPQLPGAGRPLAERVAGFSTGPVEFRILNPLAMPLDFVYNLAFVNGDSGLAYDVIPATTVEEILTSRDTLSVPLSHRLIIRDSVRVFNSAGALIDTTQYLLDEHRGLIRGRFPGALPAGSQLRVQYSYYALHESPFIGSEDGNRVFDGIRIYALNEPLGLDSARSGWAVVNNTSLSTRIQRPTSLTQPFTPIAVDFEIRWNAADTLANGKWAFPGDTLITPFGRNAIAPFRVYNVTDSRTFRLYTNSAVNDSLWRPGRELIILNPSGPINTYMAVMMSAPASGSIVLPSLGNVFVAKTTKPFQSGDRYRFSTPSTRYETSLARSQLDNIYVVPNPYVVYSSFESPGPLITSRGEGRLQFRNLPPRCTIRIYTILGELVDTIDKDDTQSFAEWDLLSYEGHRQAYGVYLYHVDVPGVGEKIGRFALIK